MLRKIFYPSPCLSAYISCYMQLELDISEKDVGILCTFPTGNHVMNVFYSLELPLFLFPNGETKVFKSFISGLLTQGVKIANYGSFNCILIYFTPLGANRLFKIPGSEYFNQFICPSELCNRWIKALEKIQESITDVQRIKYLDVFFKSLLNSTNYKERVFDDIVQNINLQRGFINVDQIITQYPVTSRTLDRQFLNLTGLTPKSYINLARLASAYKMLLHQSNYTVHDIIHYHGYYDQSHAIKEFLRYFDLTPSEIRNNPSKTIFPKLLIIDK